MTGKKRKGILKGTEGAYKQRRLGETGERGLDEDVNVGLLYFLLPRYFSFRAANLKGSVAYAYLGKHTPP